MEDSLNNFDRLFRDKLQDFEVNPPDRVWGNIHKKIQEPGKGNGKKGFTPGQGITGLIVLLLLTGVILYYQSARKTEAGQPGYTTEEIAYNNNEDISPVIATKTNNGINHTSTSGKPTTEIIAKRSSEEIQENVIPETNTNEEGEAQNILTSQENSGITLPVNPSRSFQFFRADEDISSLRNKTIDHLNSHKGPGDHSLLMNNRYSGELSDVFFDTRKQVLFTNPSWILGINIVPEIILNTPGSDSYKRGIGIEATARMQFSSYFAESGLGLSISEDNGKSTVDFERYEYLGSYEDVYDVTFDTTPSGVIPVYHTHTVDVYDSIRHISISETKNLYSYLQIPLYLGYATYFNRFGLTIKAGPVISFLASKKENVDYPYQDIRILNQNNDLPARLNTYWTMVLSAGLNYRVSSKISFNIEPGFRYYLNQVYRDSQKNINKPYSIGLRTGLLINID